MTYNVYQNQKQLGYNVPEFTIKPEYVFKEVANTQLIRGNESINPVEELAAATRMTYVGVGGVVNKDGVSEKMRVVDETYYGTIDTIDTPEGGSNIGMLQHGTVDALIKDSRGNIEVKKLDNDTKTGISSVSSVFTPFYNHDDSARLMMAANQVRQAVPVFKKEVPLVQTGYETALTTFLSKNFIKKSDFTGVVKHVDEREIIIESEEKETKGKRQKIDLTPQKLISGMTMHSISYFNTLVKVGQKVKRHQLLAEGASIKDGTMSLGTNLLVAYMPYKGANHDDAMIFNSDLVDDSIASIHLTTDVIHIMPGSKIIKVPCMTNDKVDVQLLNKLLLPNEGVKYEKGDTYLSFIPPNIAEYLELNSDDKVYVGGLIKHKFKDDGRIIDIRLYDNDDINLYPQLKHLHHFMLEKHGETSDGNYKIKGEKFEGIMIEIDYEFKESGLNRGDKYCNRHGNKGVISLVDDQMPVTPWGQKIDICWNVLGVIGRMNVGQILEGYCGLIGWKILQLIKANSSKKNVIDLIRKVYKNILDKSKDQILSKTVIRVIEKMNQDQYKSYIENLKNQKGFPWIYPTYSTPNMQEIQQALDEVGLKDKYYLDLPGYGPGVKTKTPVMVGYIYVYKMEHISSRKIASRSVGKYQGKLMQPTAGKQAGGGQRVGEFDTWSLFAHGATNIIKEMFGPQSDDLLSKNEIIGDIIEKGFAHNIDELKSTPTRDLLEVYFRMMLLDINK